MMKKRILSLLLILCMAVTLLPTAVFAEDATGKPIPEGGAKIGETVYHTLDEAMEAVNEGDTATIYLGKGIYSGNSAKPTEQGKGAGKNLTFVGAGIGETTWQIQATKQYGPDGWCDYSLGSSYRKTDRITFEKMTVVGSVYLDGLTKSNDTQGLTYINHITLKDCVFNGRADYWGYESTTFEDVTFNAPGTEASDITDGDYSLWTYTGKEYTFKNCTFNSKYGKTVNVYRHSDTGHDIVVNFEDCIFNTESHSSFSAPNPVTINDSTLEPAHKYVINFTGNMQTSGFSPIKLTCSRLFCFGADKKEKTYNTGKTIVNFGNTPVWEGGEMVNRAAYHTDGVKVDGVTYNNGVAGANDSLYAEGYKDNAFTEPTYSEWTTNSDGSQSREGTKTCKYCGQVVTFKETKEADPIDWDVSNSIIAAACLNTQDHYSYLVGYSDGTVRPNGRITRAEVATIFFRLLTDDTRQRNWSSENHFSDVSADKWYNNAVSTLCHMGVLGGYSDGTFRPNAPITRAEFAKIAVSFAQINGFSEYGYFTDVDSSDWYAPYVDAAKSVGLIEGYSDGSFKPENKITRAEACTIVNRVLGRKPSKNNMKISDRINWPDCTTDDWFYEAIMEATNSHTYQMGKRAETWIDKLPQRDWAALENNWASAYTGKGGEVH